MRPVISFAAVYDNYITTLKKKKNENINNDNPARITIII